MLKTQQEKKEYIKKHFKLSSGKRITKMLKRYWSVKEDIVEENIIETAKDIFK